MVDHTMTRVSPDGRFRSKLLSRAFLRGLKPHNLLWDFSTALLDIALAVCRDGTWTRAGEPRSMLYV